MSKKNVSSNLETLLGLIEVRRELSSNILKYRNYVGPLNWGTDVEEVNSILFEEFGSLDVIKDMESCFPALEHRFGRAITLKSLAHCLPLGLDGNLHDESYYYGRTFSKDESSRFEKQIDDTWVSLPRSLIASSFDFLHQDLHVKLTVLDEEISRFRNSVNILNNALIWNKHMEHLGIVGKYRDEIDSDYIFMWKEDEIAPDDEVFIVPISSIANNGIVYLSNVSSGSLQSVDELRAYDIIGSRKKTFEFQMRFGVKKILDFLDECGYLVFNPRDILSHDENSDSSMKI